MADRPDHGHDDDTPPGDPTGGAEPIEPDGTVDPEGTVDPDDASETRSMQAQLIAEGGSAGLTGVAVGAVLAVGSTIWLKLRRRRR
ncbi:hypothetical protein [Actinomarinicola tropica]|uniref:LPXTG cell wall anchor domain-containing protein n=1 Tax=Actinomarinicola tropica TaxID=2789776 RepID=A0A5Q2RQV0_9ACTN|nr:hypothetical protein [Actinomarinicola tropica]QGG96517.1 hypothetical protein GH723_16195 [Actinomarinicola tropica]